MAVGVPLEGINFLRYFPIIREEPKKNAAEAAL
jgi:hypothetical protein